MTTNPALHAATTSYTPPSLAALTDPPSFLFRNPDPRAGRRFRYALIEAGLRCHDSAAIERETIATMRNLWTGDADMLASNEARLRAFWQAVRDAETDPTVTIDQDEADAISEAMGKLVDASPALRTMSEQNALFGEDAPKLALCRLLAGWTGLATPYRFHMGSIPMATIDALQDEINDIEVKAAMAEVPGIAGIAFDELALHALALLGFTGAVPIEPEGIAA
ncbi:hypothetical protein [Sphingomonas oligophenolica]|uniref:Uncharacterized protein n=1 Tax=Sphingomonas oligophenolica TaxID=301154 RepID=A0A502CJ00_9SPHN|nr:hypothetical protein [Sphingomonas oligophenolica]TPG13167.1 hypothetical protein EAH84_07140 [Sphingomonas oligophenolica]